MHLARISVPPFVAQSAVCFLVHSPSGALLPVAAEALISRPEDQKLMYPLAHCPLASF
jgi:hypothetical protein